LNHNQLILYSLYKGKVNLHRWWRSNDQKFVFKEMKLLTNSK